MHEQNQDSFVFRSSGGKIDYFKALRNPNHPHPHIPHFGIMPKPAFVNLQQGSLTFQLDARILFRYMFEAQDPANFFTNEFTKLERYTIDNLKSGVPTHPFVPKGQMHNVPDEFILQGLEIFHWNKGNDPNEAGNNNDQLANYLVVSNEDLTDLCLQTLSLTRYHPLKLLPEGTDVQAILLNV